MLTAKLVSDGNPRYSVVHQPRYLTTARVAYHPLLQRIDISVTDLQWWKYKARTEMLYSNERISRISYKCYIIKRIVGHYKELSTQRPGSPKNTTQQHDVSVQSTLDRRPIYYSQKMDPSSPNANSIMWTHTSLEIKFKSNRSYFKWT